MVEERNKLRKNLISQRGPGLNDFEKSTSPDGKKDAKNKRFIVKIPCSRYKAKRVSIPPLGAIS